MNYVPLNSVTRIIAYPAPSCNFAVSEEFGMGQWMWLYNAPPGYHQLAVALASQEKLAFQAPDAIKWTYTVMPFDPVTFVSLLYNVDSQWKALTRTKAIDIGIDTNTRIIIKDIVSHGKDIQTCLLYMECQLRVCMAYHLSLSLKKSYIFPKHFKFIGNDVCPKGNRPAQSKHQLLETWPQAKIVHDVATFIGFAQFYCKYTHHFELQVTPLWALTIKRKYTNPVADIVTDACQQPFDNI